jgi:hypothetical protein
MSNFRFSALNTKSLSPNSIPGETLDDKIEWLQSHLDTELGQMFASGELTRADLYRMQFGIKPKKEEATSISEVLEPYRKTIEDLRASVSQLQRSANATGSPEQAIEQIIALLLKRKNEVVVPQMAVFYKSNKRTEEVFTPLLSVQESEQVNTVQKFIAEEITKKKLEVKAQFLEMAEYIKKTCPGITFDEILAMLKKSPGNNEKSIEKAYRIIGLQQTGTSVMDRFSMAQLMDIAGEIKRFKAGMVALSQHGTRPWNAILAMNPNMPGIDKWQELVVEPMKWSAIPILRSVGVDFSRSVSSPKEYFEPEVDDSGEPFASPQDALKYKISQLRLAVLDGYDNEHILPLVNRVTEKNDFGLNVPINPELPDNASALIRYYFTQICKLVRESFVNDLDAAGLSYVSEIINGSISSIPDKRYGDLNLTMLSGEESSMVDLLRNDFKLDALPLPISMKTPIGCPTNNSFKIDFALPCDMLESFDGNSGEPIIKRKVVLVGEYFGWSGGESKPAPWDPDIDWSTPDGSPAMHEGEDGMQAIVPGADVKSRDMYKLRTDWKIFTQNILGHMLGTAALHFDKNDLQNPENVAKKLNIKRIFYHFNKNENACSAANDVNKHLRINCVNPSECPGAEFSDTTVYSKKFDDPIEMQINFIDSSIMRIKISEGLKTTMSEYDGPGNFDRRTGYAHLNYIEQLEAEKLALLEDINPQNLARLNEITIKIRTMEESPLYGFKQAFEATLQSENFAKKFEALERLKSDIISKRITLDLAQLRVEVGKIKQGYIEQRTAFNYKNYLKHG